MIFALALFWLSAALLVYTLLGYPVVMRLLARLKQRPLNVGSLGEPPPVAIVIATYNEAARIATRIQNIVASEYPADRLRVVVVSDGSSDGTACAVRTCESKRVHLIERAVRTGKAACLNQALRNCAEPFVVFADARQSFARDAIARLLEPFGDETVGAVSGSLEIIPSTSGAGRGIDRYWQSEKRLRQAESDFDSAIGCSGAIYAIRRELWEPLPDDAVLDDVLVPMRIAERGYRIHFVGNAIAYDPQPLNRLTEIRRKTRTLAGNWQMFFLHPRWISPGGHRLWWQILSHKALRLITPMVLVIVLVSAGALAFDSIAFRGVFALQIVFYLAALLGIDPRLRWLTLPAGFVVLQYAAIRAAIRSFTGRASQWD